MDSRQGIRPSNAGAVGETMHRSDWETLEGYLPAEGRRLWNQSFYFNAYDPKNGIGCVIRAGFMEGSRSANSWMVFFMDGKPLFARYNANLSCPANRLAGGVSVGGMTLESLEPLKVARIRFQTAEFAFDLTWRAMHPLMDAIGFGQDDKDNFAAAHAHAHLEGSCFVTGTVTLRGGDRHTFEGTGGRDIAAGIRDWGSMEHYRVAWPIFTDETAAIGIHGVAGGRHSYMSMWHDGTDWTPIVETEDLVTFDTDEFTVRETHWRLRDAHGREVSYSGIPLFRCFLPADGYTLVEHIAKFTRSDGVEGYGLVECGMRLPWHRDMALGLG
ncbi:hypothetical protein V2S85_15425 [Novosphingobium resinovorum]|nr:hypothetical protein [Novosphingobium resinovorum]